MAKSLKLFRVEFFVKEHNLYDTVTYLEKIGVYNLDYKTVANVNGKGNGKAKSNVERSQNQQDWFAKIKDQFVVREILDQWEEAGFPRASIYSAIARAIDHKVLKKVKAGTYKPVGKA